MTGAMNMQAFLDKFSHVAESQGFLVKSLVETESGPILVWEKGVEGADGPLVYVSSGMHGDEPAGPLAMMELLIEGVFSAGVRWLLCPAINPCGLEAATRCAPSGIDLNRDYLNRRSPEVAAHAAWLESVPVPDLFLSLHEDYDTSGFYHYEINQGPDQPDRTWGILQAVEALMPLECADEIDGHAPRDNGWIFHVPEADEPDGWPEAIFLAKRGCPLSFTFETPSRLPLAERVAAHVAAVRAALRVVCC